MGYTSMRQPLNDFNDNKTFRGQHVWSLKIDPSSLQNNVKSLAN